MPELKRRDFLKGGAVCVAAAPAHAQQYLEHNWSGYDWGSGPLPSQS